MINILGERDGPARPAGVEAAEALGASVHVYGKRETRVDRKMGHLTVLGESLEAAYETARRARAMISI
jgi:5-(carboxyamino)imidazole ribonucleotide synthase